VRLKAKLKDEPLTLEPVITYLKKMPLDRVYYINGRVYPDKCPVHKANFIIQYLHSIAPAHEIEMRFSAYYRNRRLKLYEYKESIDDDYHWLADCHRKLSAAAYEVQQASLRNANTITGYYTMTNADILPILERHANQ
jgi:hypothetical protein